jgi:hypothetical protein
MLVFHIADRGRHCTNTERSNVKRHASKKPAITQRDLFHAADGASATSWHTVEILASVDTKGPAIMNASRNCIILTCNLGVMEEACRPYPMLMLAANKEYVIISANCHMLKPLSFVLCTAAAYNRN